MPCVCLLYTSISEFFLEGAVTYSNDAKIRRLGVRQETLAEHTAVSAEVAREMADGIRLAANASLGTVSYTHLDVYKRQYSSCPVLAEMRRMSFPHYR